jgi:hypothetical protein
MQLRVVAGAHLQRPRVRIVGVDVVVMDLPGARASRTAQQQVDGAVATREFAPRLGVVNRSVFHAASLAQTLRYAVDTMGGVVTNATQPLQIVERVRAALRTKHPMVDVDTCPAFARVTGAVEAF